MRLSRYQSIAAIDEQNPFQLFRQTIDVANVFLIVPQATLVPISYRMPIRSICT
jgi:hypothetical protein